MGLSSSSNRQDVPWLRLQRPVSVIMMGLMSAGKWNLMHHIALGDPSKPELETKDVMRDEWQNKVQLQQMAMTSMNIGDIMSVKYNRRLKALVKEHSDGIILVIDATRTDSQDMEEILSELKQYVLDANETKDSVLLVLVNRSDKEGAISIHQIEQNVTETLVRHNRGSQCFTVRPVSSETGVGIWHALDWFVDELNNRGKEISDL